MEYLIQATVAFENMSWFTYLNGSFKYVIKKKAGWEDDSTVYGYNKHTGQWSTGGEGQLVWVTGPTPRGSDLIRYFTTRRPWRGCLDHK